MATVLLGLRLLADGGVLATTITGHLRPLT